MRPILAALLIALALVSARPAAADETSDIQAVIADQIADFVHGDVAAAFAHASPGIQKRFGTPETFGDMVRTAYPMIWAPAHWKMEAAGQTAEGPVQTVQVEDGTGALWEADYLMEKVGGEWRIAGVTLRRLAGATS